MTIPYKGYLEIRGEALIPWKYYNEMNKDGTLGHPRNVASGGLRQLDANEAAKRNIYFYAFTLVNWRDIGVKTKFESLRFLYNNGFDVVALQLGVGFAHDEYAYPRPAQSSPHGFNTQGVGLASPSRAAVCRIQGAAGVEFRLFGVCLTEVYLCPSRMHLPLSPPALQ